MGGLLLQRFAGGQRNKNGSSGDSKTSASVANMSDKTEQEEKATLLSKNGDHPQQHSGGSPSETATKSSSPSRRGGVGGSTDPCSNKHHHHHRKRGCCWRSCKCCCVTFSLLWCLSVVFFTLKNVSSKYHDAAELLSHGAPHAAGKQSQIREVEGAASAAHVGGDDSLPSTSVRHGGYSDKTTSAKIPTASGDGNAKLEILQHLNASLSGVHQAKPLTKKGDTKWPSWQEMVQVKATAAKSLDEKHPLPDAPLHLVRLNQDHNENADNNSTKPLVAIVTSTRSTSRNTKAADTMLWKYLIKSILDTVIAVELQEFRVHLFVAVDDIDVWWLQHCHELQSTGSLQWLPVTFGVFPKRGHHIPFNEMAYTAYLENATYFCRVNDDTQFKSKKWISEAVATLQAYDPPNIGVTGPKCDQGNTNILTHDFVHRHHMEIFGGLYYPPCFNNWYLDDWISFVYSRVNLGPDFHRFSVLKTWKVKHWVFAKRYNTNVVDAQWLPTEYERGRRLIKAYVDERFSSEKVYKIGDSLPVPQTMDPGLVDAILQVLPSDGGNLLVWGLDTDSHFWHRATTGRVVFLNDAKYPENMQVTASQPYLEIYHTKHHLDRGPEAQQKTFEQYVVGANNSSAAVDLCDLQMSQFPTALLDTVWDVVVVDAPLPVVGLMAGMDELGPGVFQSLYTTHRLVATSLAKQNKAGKETTAHIFLQHYQRPYERDFSRTLFGKEPVHVLKTTSSWNSSEISVAAGEDEHAHFVLAASDPVVQQLPHCDPPPIRDPSLFSDKVWATAHLERIFEVLPRKGGNMLIWGVVESSPLFANATTNGHIVFLEDEGSTQLATEKVKLKGMLQRIKYTTENSASFTTEVLSQSPEEWKNALSMKENPHHFPESLLFNIPWDVILVMGPNASGSHDPGKSQSLYMSQVLAENSHAKLSHPLTHVFVMNYENSFERTLSQKLFGGEPANVLSAKPAKLKNKPAIEMAHFMVGDSGAIAEYKKKVAARSTSVELVPWMFVEADAAAPASPMKSPSSWVVVMQVSFGVYDLFLNWLSYYKKLELGMNVVVIAEDDAVQAKLEAEVLPTNNSEGGGGVQVLRSELELEETRSFDYEEDKFKLIVATRAHHIHQQLQAGKSVIYADVDTVWRSSPLPYLAAVGGDQVDLIGHVDAENLQKFHPWYGTGFLAIAANVRTVRFMADLSKRLFPLVGEPQMFQPLFNELLHTAKLVRHQPLPAIEFPNGGRYFGNVMEEERKKAIIVHNNFIMGHDAKVVRFKEHGLWDPLKSG